jgi:N-acetylmuramoyl-L-alanine amidase
LLYNLHKQLQSKLVRRVFTILITVCLTVSLFPGLSHSFGNEILKVGSKGGDVYELQGRLSYLGYYTGRIDGDFGWRTYWAVRNFQYNFGLRRVDGIVGPKTKLMLWKATKNWSPGNPSGAWSTLRFSANDITLLARTVYGEARGEPYTGQVAVAAVVLNRIESKKFPNTISGVIFQPGAFTAVSDGQIWLGPNDTAYKAARDAINGWDPSGNALYYFNPATATSAWIWSRPQIKQIGKHIFCK